jgi:glycosyltransferase involved in cell wall biosynthesis
MPHADLGPQYRAADVAVWPTNESTSMLDAAACGLPLVVSDGIAYRDHVEGNGVVVRMNDLDDLVDHLRRLGDPDERRRLGSAGARKMAERFSWDRVARLRLRDYERAVAFPGGRP